MTAVINLSNTTFAILDALRVYRFLTAAQLLRLGVCSHQPHLSLVLREIGGGSKPLVEKIANGTIPGIGRLPHFHFLTKRGAEILADALGCDPADVPYPHGVTLVRHDFFHRLHTVDCEITVRQWAQSNDATVRYFHQYFKKTGANRSKSKGLLRATTKIDLPDDDGIIPDAVFQLEFTDGRTPLFLLEMQNENRADNVYRKINKYCSALEEGAINRQFEYSKAPRILFVFVDDKALHYGKKRIAELPDIGNFSDYFYFQTLPALQADFWQNWQGLHSTAPVNLGEPAGAGKRRATDAVFKPAEGR